MSLWGYCPILAVIGRDSPIVISVPFEFTCVTNFFGCGYKKIFTQTDRHANCGLQSLRHSHTTIDNLVVCLCTRTSSGSSPLIVQVIIIL